MERGCPYLYTGSKFMQASLWSLDPPSSRVAKYRRRLDVEASGQYICCYSEVLAFFYFHLVKLYLQSFWKVWSFDVWFVFPGDKTSNPLRRSRRKHVEIVTIVHFKHFNNFHDHGPECIDQTTMFIVNVYRCIWGEIVNTVVEMVKTMFTRPGK